MPTSLEIELGRRLAEDEYLLLLQFSLLSDEQKEVFQAKLDAAYQKNLHKQEKQEKL